MEEKNERQSVQSVNIDNQGGEQPSGEQTSTEQPKPRYIRGKYCEGQRESTNKFLRENYFNIRFRKSCHDTICAAAETVGMSMSAFANDAVMRRACEILDERDAERKKNNSKQP